MEDPVHFPKSFHTVKIQNRNTMCLPISNHGSLIQISLGNYWLIICLIQNHAKKTEDDNIVSTLVCYKLFINHSSV